MINFSELPKESPNVLPAPNIYKAKIIEAVMKDPSATAKSKVPYLNLKYQLTDINGNSAGTIYDMLFDSDNQVLQYKLARFLTACNIPLQGAMELKDVAKIVLNKEIVVDVKITVDKSGKYPDKAEVDTFVHEIYYRLEEFAAIHAVVNNLTPKPSADEFINTGTETTDGAQPSNPANY